MKSQHSGFTLIELMVALTLGLILTGAAITLFINAQSSYRIQQAASTLQDGGVFGMAVITKNLRLANYGNSGAMNDGTLYGGVIISAQTTTGVTAPATTVNPNGNLNGLKYGTTLISGDGYISKAAYNDSAYGSVKSDQLVIAYQAPRDMVTCQGANVQGPNRSLTALTKGWYVIEKYYVKKRTTGSGADLYCSSAFFIAKDETVSGTFKTKTGIEATQTLTSNYGSNSGDMLIPNVEYMRVQLIIRNSDGTTGTMGIDDYNAISLTSTKPNRPAIIGLNMGILVRSADTVKNNKMNTYTVLDRNITVPDDSYMRTVYSTTIALRNGGLGDIIQ